MHMEKRTLLAFVLSFLVLIIWMHFFTPQQDPSQWPQEPVEEEIPPKREIPRKLPDTSISPDSHEPSANQPLPDKSLKVDEKEIQVNTPLYRAVFTNAGPTITSFKLKKYRRSIEPDSPLIELVNLEENRADFFLAQFISNPSLQDKKIVYLVDREKALHLMPGDSPEELGFHFVTSEGLMIRQTFRFYADQYQIDMQISVLNQSGVTKDGIISTEIQASPKEKKGYYSYVGLVLLLNNELEEVELEDPLEEKTLAGNIDWMAYEDDYFLSAVIPEERDQGTFKGVLTSSGVLKGAYRTSPISLGTSQNASSKYTLYFGPRDLKVLKRVGNGLDKAVDFGWFDIIAKGLLYVLLFFNQFIHNYGVSIILLTVLIKILFWPLTHKSYKSMKEMQKLQPIMAKIREKYKNDRQKMNMEMMSLYKTYKVNPMGGCLPMLVQLPVFFALFRLLGSSIELRHAPFILWINDLSAPDRLFHFPFSIPLMSPPCGIPVLTLLMGASMFLQQKMTPTPGDPTQAKMMMLMPVIFTFMFINFPSGLVLYWLVNNILSIGQQYRILKRSA